MTNNDNNNLEELFKGLQSLSDSAFPKHCSNCGRYFDTVEEFLIETTGIRDTTGLKGSLDDDRPLVELYRNCVCGSTDSYGFFL